MRIQSRRDAMTILLGSALAGLTGCMEDNEKDFAPVPGKVDPNIPTNAEDYEKQFQRKKGEA